MQNPTMSWTPKLKRTISGFQRSLTRLQTNGSLGVMIFGRRRSCWNCILERMQRRKKNQIWGCLDGFLPLSCIAKCWATLQNFHWLLIQPHPTNSLEVTEFWGSTSLLNSIWNRMAVEWNWTLEPWIDRNSGSPEYHYGRQLPQFSDGP
jgi:hypothetical protein